MHSVDKVLDEIMQLDFSTREMLVEILNKRQIEERRADIKRSEKKAKLDYSRGKLGLAAGMYFIRVSNENETMVGVVVKE